MPPHGRRTPRTCARSTDFYPTVSTVEVLPQATGSRASKSVSGKFARTKSMSCMAVSTVRSFAVPALDQPERVGRGLGIDRVEGLVERY